MIYKGGDLVQLKSGGPKMTVIDTPSSYGQEDYTTAWFAGAKRETGRFPEDALMPAAEDGKK